MLHKVTNTVYFSIYIMNIFLEVNNGEVNLKPKKNKKIKQNMYAFLEIKH